MPRLRPRGEVDRGFMIVKGQLNVSHLSGWTAHRKSTKATWSAVAPASEVRHLRLSQCRLRLPERRDMRQLRGHSIDERALAPWRFNNAIDQRRSCKGTEAAKVIHSLVLLFSNCRGAS